LLLFCYSCGSIGNVSAAADRWAIPVNHQRNFRGRGTAVYENDDTKKSREAVGDQIKNQKKNDKWAADENKNKETESPTTTRPSQDPSQSTQSPSRSVSTDPTNFPSSNPALKSERDPVELELHSFSLLIQGSVSLEDELEIRQELQVYLLDYFRGEKQQQIEYKVDSVGLEFVQLVESYLPFNEFHENERSSSGDNPNRIRRLLQDGRRNEHQRKRVLQTDWSTSAISTLLEYEARVVIGFGQEGDVVGPIDEEVQVALKDDQIEALENTDELQTYFIHVHEDRNEIVNKDTATEYPVVLMAIQVADRPLKSLNFKETWQTIESTLLPDSSSTINTINNGDQDGGHESNGGNPWDDKNEKEQGSLTLGILEQSASSSINSSKDKNSSTWKVVVGIGCTIIILTALGGLIYIWREKRRNFSSTEIKSFSGEDDSHVIEVTSDVGSNELTDNITYDKSVLRSDGSSGGENKRRKNTKRSKTFFSSELLRIGKQQSGTSNSAQGVSSSSPVTNTKKKDCDENRNGRTKTSATNSSTCTSNNSSFESSNSRNHPDSVGVSLTARNENNRSHSRQEEAVIDLTIPAARDSNGYQTIEDRHPGKKSSFILSAMSLFQNSSTSRTKEEEQPEPHDDELDSITAKMNVFNVTSNDDDSSMMGYSLASLSQNNNHEGHHDDNNTIEDLDENMSVASSQSGRPYPMFAGLHNILNTPNRDSISNSPVQDTVQVALPMRSHQNAQQDHTHGLLGSIEDEDESYINTNFETECEQDVSFFKADDATKERDLSSVMSDFPSADIIGYDSQLYENDNPLTMAKNITSVGAPLIPDDASDAPSDERNDDRFVALPGEQTSSRIQFPDAITNSRLLDSDPAVVDYLEKDRRSIQSITRMR